MRVLLKNIYMLTKKEKLKIAEEEKYRSEVQQSLKHNGRKSKLVMLLFLSTVLMGFVIMASGTAKPSHNASTETGISLISEGTIFDDYNYSINLNKSDSKYYIFFEPFMPANLIGGTMISFINEIYGANTGGETVRTVTKSGVEVWAINSTDGGAYYSYPIFEDTGEAHTLVLWKE